MLRRPTIARLPFRQSVQRLAAIPATTTSYYFGTTARCDLLRRADTLRDLLQAELTHYQSTGDKATAALRAAQLATLERRISELLQAPDNRPSESATEAARCAKTTALQPLHCGIISPTTFRAPSDVPSDVDAALSSDTTQALTPPAHSTTAPGESPTADGSVASNTILAPLLLTTLLRKSPPNTGSTSETDRELPAGNEEDPNPNPTVTVSGQTFSRQRCLCDFVEELQRFESVTSRSVLAALVCKWHPVATLLKVETEAGSVRGQQKQQPAIVSFLHFQRGPGDETQSSAAATERLERSVLEAYRATCHRLLAAVLHGTSAKGPCQHLGIRNGAVIAARYLADDAAAASPPVASLRFATVYAADTGRNDTDVVLLVNELRALADHWELSWNADEATRSQRFRSAYGEDDETTQRDRQHHQHQSSNNTEWSKCASSFGSWSPIDRAYKEAQSNSVRDRSMLMAKVAGGALLVKYFLPTPVLVGVAGFALLRAWNAGKIEKRKK